jgi:TctA family transporter
VDAYEKLRPFMSLVLVLIVILLIMSEPAQHAGRGARCVLVLSRLKLAERALGPGGMHYGDEASGAVFIRPFMAPRFAGRTVCVTGMVSDVREHNGTESLTLEEGGRLDIVVPEGLRHEPVRTGDIVFAEGRVALEVGWRAGAGRKLLALAVFWASGVVGLLVLESGRLSARNWFPLGAPPVPDAVMMFPLFCGLFGMPTLLLGLWERPANPPQELLARPLGLGRALGAVLSGTLAGGLMGWYPGMTSAHGSVVARLLGGDGTDPETGPEGRLESAREFLVSVSAVMMANVFFNIVALFVIMRARSGALHIAQDILGGGLDPWSPAGAVPPSFALLALSAAVAASVACPVTLFLGMRLARLYDRVPYRRLLACVVVFLLGLLFVFSGIAGLAVMALALCLGLVPPLAGVRRVHLMGAILVPVIAYYCDALPGVMSFLGF